MIKYRKAPANLFSGSPEIRSTLMALLGPPQPAEIP
jgi:hypothetical protein